MQKLLILVEVSYLGVRLRGENQADKSLRTKPMELSSDVSGLASSLRIDSFDYSDAASFQLRENQNFNSSMKSEMMELLEQWEEPEPQGADEEVGFQVWSNNLRPTGLSDTLSCKRRSQCLLSYNLEELCYTSATSIRSRYILETCEPEKIV